MPQAAAAPAGEAGIPRTAPARPAEPEPLPAAPAEAPRAFRTRLGGIPVSGIAFDSRTHRLLVADQPGGPGSLWADAAAAAASRGGLAALNGGFFTPEGAPLGLVIAGGKRAGSPNRASSLGAGFYAGGNTPALLRRERWSSGAAEALQSGPFLIERGRPVAGLSGASSGARSFIAWDGGHRWLLARTGACSLADLAEALRGTEPGGVPIRHALNLDGGRSSDLWISPSVEGGPLSERPFWNKPVRNFLILVPRT